MNDLITFRLPTRLINDINALVDALNAAGAGAERSSARVNRQDVARMALRRGLHAMLDDLSRSAAESKTQAKPDPAAEQHGASVLSSVAGILRAAAGRVSR